MKRGRVETWRGGANRSVSTSRSSNQTCGSPASGSRRKTSCLHPREAPLPPLQAEDTKPREGHHVGESLLADAVDLVAGVEPHPQPVSDAVVHGSVGPADTPAAALDVSA